jgi:hypothetical protein
MVATMQRPAILAVIGLALAIAAPASADTIAAADRAASEDLDAAEQALHDLRYEQAVLLLERAHRSGQNGPRALARLYRLHGELAATLGDTAGARRAFAQWLAIEPRASLAAGTSPKITATFAAAAAQLDGASLDVGFVLVDGGAAVALEVRSDPLAMIAGARCFYPGRAEVGRVAAGVARVTLALPGTGPVQVVVAALDVHGNRLVEHELTLERGRAANDPPVRAARPPTAAPTATPRVATPAPAPAAGWRFHRGWALGSAAVVLGAVGGGFAVRAARAQDELDDLNRGSAEHDFREAEEVAARLRTSAIVANAGLALAGGCALAAVLLWPEAPPEHLARRVSWQVGPDGAVAALEWSW